MSSRAEAAGIAGAALLLVLLLAIRFDAPWRYIHDDNGALSQAWATAQLRAGIAATGGQAAMVRRSDGGLDRYLHHPPLWPLTLAAVYAVTGHSGTTITRFVPAFCHAVVGFAAMVVLAFTLFPASRARRLAALAIYAVVPMSAYFGKMPNYEAIGLAWTLAAMAATCRWRAHGSRGALAWAAAFWALAGLSAWGSDAVALGVIVLLAIEARRGGRPGSGRAAWTVGAVTVLVAIAAIAQIRIVAGRDPSVFAAGGHWATTSMSPREMLHALGTVVDFHRMYFANVPFVLYVVWTVLRIRDLARRRPLGATRRFVLAGTLALAVYALAFLRALAIHAYGQFWFLPFEAFAAADLAVSAWDALASRRGLRLAFATFAIAGTVASSAFTLAYRYRKPHGFAVRTTRELEAMYYLHP